MEKYDSYDIQKINDRYQGNRSLLDVAGYS